jgi:hypothetical protein
MLVALLLLQSGCERSHTEDDRLTVSIRGRKYVLLEPADAKPVDMNGVKLVGCTEKERDLIAGCLGRIPTNLSITEVEVAWAEMPTAARVRIHPDTLIYLRKEQDGSWVYCGGLVIDEFDLPPGERGKGAKTK